MLREVIGLNGPHTFDTRHVQDCRSVLSSVFDVMELDRKPFEEREIEVSSLSSICSEVFQQSRWVLLGGQ